MAYIKEIIRLPRINIMEEFIETRSCIEILANDIKIYTIYQYICSTNQQKKLQSLYGGSSSFKLGKGSKYIVQQQRCELQCNKTGLHKYPL